MSLWIEKKYLGIVSNQLRNFVWLDQERSRFSCPFCGDSKTDDRKARGYFITKSDHRGPRLSFYCHNCHHSCGVEKFLEHVAPYLAGEFLVEKLKDRGVSKKKEAVVEKVPVARKPVAKKMPATNVIDLASTHPAAIYLNSRKIPEKKFNEFFWAPDFKLLVDYLAPNKYPKLKSEPRLCLLMRDKDANVFGIIGRTLETSDDNLRYITIKFDDEALKLFGMHVHRQGLPTFITEGAVDSLFLPNSIAMCGSAINIPALKKIIDPSKAIVCMDNEPRNVDVVRMMTKFAMEGFGVCVWKNIQPQYKDINKMITDLNVTSREILTFISRNTYTSAAAVAAIGQWKNC